MGGGAGVLQFLGALKWWRMQGAAALLMGNPQLVRLLLGSGAAPEGRAALGRNESWGKKSEHRKAPSMTLHQNWGAGPEPTEATLICWDKWNYSLLSSDRWCEVVEVCISPQCLSGSFPLKNASKKAYAKVYISDASHGALTSLGISRGKSSVMG